MRRAAGLRVLGRFPENRCLESASRRATSHPMSTQPETCVLFNADCPVCSVEIRAYSRHARARDLPIRFDDLNSCALADWSVDSDTAALRLHVLHRGQLSAGIPAFLVLWAQMPRYRWLARLVGLPGLRHLASFGYDHLLAPAIYHWHLRRQRRAAPPARE